MQRQCEDYKTKRAKKEKPPSGKCPSTLKSRHPFFPKPHFLKDCDPQVALPIPPLHDSRSKKEIQDIYGKRKTRDVEKQSDMAKA